VVTSASGSIVSSSILDGAVSSRAPNALPLGLYERLITKALRRELDTLASGGAALVRTGPVDPAEAAGILARHVEALCGHALEGLPEQDRKARQAAVVNRVIATLSSDEALRSAVAEDDAVEVPPTELQAVWPITGDPALDRVPARPTAPLSASDLLVNARGEPALAHALGNEILSADSIDLLCAFVRWHGLRVLEEPLRAHRRAGRRLRVITTVYTGSTERKALDWLLSLGAEVKVSYDTQSTRLHAKAWLFRRATGYSTAYIGSSNLSKSALLDGVEWNVRLSQVGSPDVLDKFDATFESYWSSPEYEPYTGGAEQSTRLDRALSSERSETLDAPLAFVEVTAWPHQREILEKLDAERKRHHRWKNLVVAATGTGKTVVAALDYKRLRDERTFGTDPRLLFVAHRQEILRQSLGMFRQVLRDGQFGELYVAGAVPDEWRHVFGSVQSLSQMSLDWLKPDAFDVVVVDEFHRAGAPTYQRLLSHLKPALLLGLTATPERTDSEDILHYFDGHIAAEMRLWDALERNLVCPFQYFGVHDNVDLSSLRWSRGTYDVGDLEKIYTGDDARVRMVLQQVADKHRDGRAMRALGFCVSVKHAEYMSRKFTEAGLPALSVSADTTDDERIGALKKLRAGDVRAIFAVDLFNEGVDIPEVDTLLFLRPTESALVFLQQLGRGLRRSDGKDCVTVLDFIGQAHAKFRFDLRYRAITGATRPDVERQIERGFPFLPAGCSMQLDRVATEIVLKNIRQAIPSRRPAMERELRMLLASDQFEARVPSLHEFLQATGLELEDVYKSGSWSGLKRAAGIPMPAQGPIEDKLGDGVWRLLHVDDPQRLSAYSQALASLSSEGLDEPTRRLVAGLHFGLVPTADAPATLDASLALLRQHPAIVAELVELFALLEERSDHLTYPLDQALGWAHCVSLSVHARHTVRDILSAFGILTVGGSTYEQKGVFRDQRTDSDLFLVTLEKSERDYSPSTLYKDYAISPELFHWESQSGTAQQSPTGQRYIHHRERGGHILLFVRQRRKQDGRTMPYTFLGPADYVSHKGDRPISFVWRLHRPMPAAMFRESKVAAG
jgi:superfamily II DNA or RNA helicase/HKD family nuclease